MELAAPANCEALLDELLNQSIAVISRYQIASERSSPANRDCWQVIYLSPGCQTVYGYSANELVADQALWRARRHPADWEAVGQAIDRSFKTASRSIALEYRVYHADNSLRWISESLTLCPDSLTTGWTATGIALDITERKQSEVRLQSLIEGTAAVTGTDFFPALARHIAETLGVAYVLVSELNGCNQTLHTLAFWANGELQTNFGYPLLQTPCEITMAQGVFCCPADVQMAFPADLDLIEMRAESYLGVAFKDAQGRAIGNLCLVDTQPLRQPQQAEAILRVFAARAAAELERQKSTLALEQLNHELEAQIVDCTIELRQSEAQLRDVLNGAITTAIFSCRLFADRTWRYDVISAGCETLYGYTAEEFAADPQLWVSQVVPEDMEQVILPAIDRLFTEQPTTVEYRYWHKDHSLRWISTVYTARRNDAADCWNVVGVSTDVTQAKRDEIVRRQLEADRQQAQLELQAQKDFLQRVIDTVPGCIMVKDTAGYIQVANQALAELYDTTVEAILGKRVVDFTFHLSPAQREAFLLEDQKVMQTGQPLVKEDWLTKPAGKVCWYQVSLKPFVDLQGQIQGIIGNTIDITDRHFSQVALQHSQQQYQTLVNSVDAIVWQGALRGSKFEFTFVSQQSERILGYAIERWQEPDFWSNHVHPDDLDRAIEHRTACLKAHQDYIHEYRMRAADNRFIWVEDKTKVIVENNQTQHMVGLVTDISDRKQTELLLQQQQQMLRAIIDHAPLWIWMIDRNRKVYLVNKTFTHDVGILEADFLAANDYVELFGAEASAPCIESDAACWAADVPTRSIESQFFNGRQHTLEVIKTQLKDAEGSVTHLIGIALDVTDRIAAEAALRHSEETLRLVVQNMPVMLDAYDADANLIVWNRECERVTGFSAQEITHSPNSLELLYPDSDDRAQMLREWTDHAGDFRDWEWDVTCKDNSRKTILWSNVSQEFPIPGWAGWAIGIDISDRKAAERSLRDSEERYRTLVDNMPGVVYRCANNQDRTAYYLSDRIFDFAGCAASELMPPSARTFDSITHPDDAEALWVATQQGLAADGLYQGEYRIVHKNGKIRWVLARGRGCYAPDGTLLWLDGILFDVTDRKQAETQLRDLSDRLSLAVKSGAIGIWDWDLVTNQLIWDERMCELYGVDRAESTRTYQDWSSQIHPDDRAAVEALIQQALRGEQEYDLEYQIILPDRTVRFIKSRGLVQHNPAGEPQRIIGINFDVSDRRQAEDKLRQANDTLAIANLELARANRLKDEFLANMTHELRTPLSAVLGLSSVLQQEAFGSLNEKQRQFIDTIASSGNHLLALINDILDLAKIESGRFDLELAPVSIHDLCQTSLTLVEPLAQQKNISIAAQMPPESSVALLDERRICQVLINLLGNAVKFTPAHGQVALQVKLSRHSIRFVVTDTGIGIAPADRVLLFQPFTQIDSSLSRQQDGTGLGLALVKQIVELHGGSIGVESELGKGSCFMVTIPHRS